VDLQSLFLTLRTGGLIPMGAGMKGMEVGAAASSSCTSGRLPRHVTRCRDAKNDTLIFIIDLIKLSKMRTTYPTPTVRARSARTSTPHRDDHRSRRRTTAATHGDLQRHVKSSSTRRAPATVNSFVYLARCTTTTASSFRVIPGFVLQGGTPRVLAPVAGYKIQRRTAPSPVATNSFTREANAGPNTNGSQFFVIFRTGGVRSRRSTRTFGKVVKGLDVFEYGIGPSRQPKETSSSSR